MENSENDKLKKLIREAGTESPSPDFTEFVMHSIQMEAESEMIVSAELKNVLQKITVEKPSVDFTKTVMLRVDAQSKVPSYKIAVEPVISTKVWYMVAAASVSIIILLGFLYYSLGDISANSPASTRLDGIFSLVSYNVANLPFAYSAALIAISSLLLMDYFLRNRFLKSAF